MCLWCVILHSPYTYVFCTGLLDFDVHKTFYIYDAHKPKPTLNIELGMQNSARRSFFSFKLQTPHMALKFEFCTV